MAEPHPEPPPALSCLARRAAIAVEAEDRVAVSDGHALIGAARRARRAPKDRDVAVPGGAVAEPRRALAGEFDLAPALKKRTASHGGRSPPMR